MPAVLDRCVRQLMAQGYSESEAWAICQSRLKPKEKDAKNISNPCGCSNHKVTDK